MMRSICVFILLIPLITVGQHAPQKPISSFSSLISTPQAQQFQRYGEVPVDYSTGVPSISIPLGKLSIKNIDWPFELSYYSRGHKVGDVSSNIGLGWLLKGFGMISANAFGKPDTHFPLETDSMLMRRDLDLGAGEPSPNGCTYQNIVDKNKADEVVLVGKMNVLPDIYHLNIGERYHKMFILGDSAYTMPASDLKIKLNRTYSGTSVSSVAFFVIDEKGTKYYFNQRGHNFQRNFCAGTRFSVSENNYLFCLDSVVNVFNEKLSFYYSLDNYSYFMPSFRQEFVNEHESWSDCFSIIAPAPVTCTPKYKAIEPRVDSIVASNGSKVVLQYSTRTDIPSTETGETGGSRITSFKYYHQQQLRYAYDFEQDYFISPGGTTSEFYRLRLKSITLKDKNLLSDQKYTLLYNSTLLPGRFSNSIDSAGFYNGISNSTNIPKFSDRSFDEANTKACILESIKYPTGGTSQFEYELNSPGIGGLRIKRITSTPLQGLQSIKRYAYTNFSPNIESFTNSGYTYHAGGGNPMVCDYWIYQSLPYRILHYEYSDRYNFKYEQVEEYLGENGENGKISYRYGTFPDYNYTDNSHPYVLVEKKQYKKSGSLFELIEKETYTYNSFTDSSIMGKMYKNSNVGREKRVWGKEITLFIKEQTLPHSELTSICFPSLLGEGVIVLNSNANLMSERITTTYAGIADSIVTSEKYFYSISDHLQPIKIETTNSLGDTKYTLFKYPTQYGNLTGTDNLTKGIKNLKDRNIFDMVEETKFVIKSGITYLLSGSFNSYKSGLPVIDSTLEFKLSTPLLGTSYFSSGNSGGKVLRDPKYIPESIYSLYDATGNIQERYKYQDIKETYLWGYNSQYPVAKVVGADYATAILQVSQTILNNPTNDQALRLELNKLRTNLTGAHITTYTYNLLWGMTSETDPAGRTTFYEYDALGRLKLIRDHDNKIIKYYDYQFQAPITQ